jgi:hypothetical protein
MILARCAMRIAAREPHALGTFPPSLPQFADLAVGSLLQYPFDLGANISPSADRDGVILSIEYLSERLMPHPLPTKDGGVLRTIGDAHAYMQALSKTRKSRAHWKRASLLLMEEVGAAALTRQVQVALVVDGKLDPMFERMSNARRWPDAYKQED